MLTVYSKPNYIQLEEIKQLGFKSMPVVTLDKNFDNAWVGYNLDRLLELKELG